MTKFFDKKARAIKETPLSGSLPARASLGEREDMRRGHARANSGLGRE
jgi:hypothetical protein